MCSKKAVKPSRKRQLVDELIRRFGASFRQACAVLPDQTLLSMRVKEITEVRVQYGYRRVHVLRRREGWNINHKRVYRLYSLQGLALDALFDGRRLRTLTVMDNYTRECLSIHVDAGIRGEQVVEVIERICAQRGTPFTIHVDNGTEFISKVLDKWAYERGVALYFSRPGKPTDNAYIESFNGRFREIGSLSR